VRDALVHLVPWTLAGSDRDELLYVLSLGALLLGTLLALLALPVRRLDVLAVAVAAGGAAAWLLSSGPGEGGTIVEVLPDNGLTVADLAAVPAFLLVGVLAARRVLSAS
jgi:hypothetical protein